MACFIVPVAEAIVATAVTKVVKTREMKHEVIKHEVIKHEVIKPETDVKVYESETLVPLSRKLKWLSNMLWGGSLLLAFEHVWHGEVTPWFPFLTAANDPAEATAMLGEMATVGVLMAVLITAVWGGICVVTKALEKETQKTSLNSGKN